MKNWKAAVRRWIFNDSNISQSGKNQHDQSFKAKNEESLPDWFDKKQENEPMTEDERQELDDILNSLCGDTE